ncbi:MAG: diaminopimelate decarboxylase [Chloroflexota bacterium]|nr:diaminopimelate decarboxylase [Chloroflexota bacterium]
MGLSNDILPITARRGSDGRLFVGGCDTVALARECGTPLYLYDQATMDAAVAGYRDALARHWPGRAEVAYAAKAWLSTALAQWAAARGLGMDVVSEGELRQALHAGFPPERLHAHGNNKPDGFLRACVGMGAGRVAIDHPREAEQLAAICDSLGKRQGVWLRLNPATVADTHASIETGSATSKFGLSLIEGDALRVARFVHNSPHLDWQGVHFHIGSQFTDTIALRQAIRRVFEWLARVRAELGWIPAEFSPGGGWAVPYLPDEPYLAPDVAIPELVDAIVEGCDRLEMELPTLVLEPGRELVARAGVALYTVGTVKQAASVRYAFLDGGLADNPRPALYGARYHTLLADREGTGPQTCYSLAGPFCESGDTLVREITLPGLQEGDLLAVPVSGAYQLSMASNYNGATRPAVLWLHEGRAQVVQRRERIEELWKRDCLIDLEP